MGSKFHACATCKHFSAERIEGSINYHCIRLGYETNPKYRFSCWDPRPHIVNLMKKEGGER
jgi:hypothetical protein